MQCGPASDDASWGEVHRIFVDPKAWGGGAARLLMEHALTELTNRNLDKVVVWAVDTPQAFRFYEKFGFSRTDHEKVWQYGKTTVNDIRFERCL